VVPQIDGRTLLFSLEEDIDNWVHKEIVLDQIGQKIAVVNCCLTGKKQLARDDCMAKPSRDLNVDNLRSLLGKCCFVFSWWRGNMDKLVRFLSDETGVTAIEYALIAGTTALVLVAVLPSLQSALEGEFTSVADGMQ